MEYDYVNVCLNAKLILMVKGAFVCVHFGICALCLWKMVCWSGLSKWLCFWLKCYPSFELTWCDIKEQWVFESNEKVSLKPCISGDYLQKQSEGMLEVTSVPYWSLLADGFTNGVIFYTLSHQKYIIIKDCSYLCLTYFALGKMYLSHFIRKWITAIVN